MLGFNAISGNPFGALTSGTLVVGFVSTSSFTIIAAGLDVLYAATMPFITRATDVPANQPFYGTLEATMRIDRSIITTDGFSGFAENLSELSLINADGFYDDIVDQISVNGQPVSCSIGEVTGRDTVAPYATFERVMNFVAERVRMERLHVVIEMRDPSLSLSTETVQQQVYAGTGDLEGSSEISGKRRPFGDGVIFNATPTLVIANELLWQFNAGPVTSVDAVKDGGLELTFGGDYPTVAALRVATGGNDSYTKILLHFDGTDASTTFTDDNAGGSAHTWTAAGNAQLDTANLMFGSATGLFDGAGDWITTPDHADFNLGSGDWTLDCQFNVAGGAGTFRWMGGQGDLVNNTNRSVGLLLDQTTSAVIGAAWVGGSQFTLIGTTSFTSPGWHHAALVRTGNVLKLFVDGVQEGGNLSITGTINNSTAPFGVGVEGNGGLFGWNGWIDEFRLSVGIARWTTNFAPPPSAYAATLQPGFYATCLTEGYFILGGASFKQITVDFTGRRLTTSDIIRHVAATSTDLSAAEWDPDTINDPSRLIESNCGRTLTATGGSVGLNFNVVSYQSHSAGKYVFSFLLGTLPGFDIDYGIGFAISNEIRPLGRWYGDDTDTIALYASGDLWYNENITGDLPSIPMVAGDRVTIAVNLDARRIWAKLNNGNWNSNALADPATNVGGVDIRIPSGEIWVATTINAEPEMHGTVNFDANDLPVGFSNWDEDDIDCSAFEDLNAAQPATVGYYLGSDSSETASEMFTKLMHGIGGWFGMTPLGKLQVKRFDRPIEVASTFYDTHGGNIVDIDRMALPAGVDPPPHRWRMIYGRNWTVMTDLFGAVSENDPAMADYLTSPYKLATTTELQSMEVLANWPDAPDPNPVESYFAEEADAQDEAERSFQLYTIGLNTYRFTLKNALFVHEIGEIVNVTDSRLGLANGRYLRIVHLTENLDTKTTEAVGFG